MNNKENERIQLTQEELDSYLQTDHKTGLSSEEALRRQEKFGLNLSLIHISEPTRLDLASRMPSSAWKYIQNAVSYTHLDAADDSALV